MKNNGKPTKYRGTENPEYAAAMRGLRGSSAASPHADSRDKRARTRAASVQRDLREYR